MRRHTCLLSELAALILLIAGPVAAAQEPPSASALARLDGYAMAAADTGTFSGVVLVAHDGNVVFEKAYGPRDQTSDEPADIAMRYNLASAGKMFTATGILQLIAAGKLQLDTTVGSVLKDYPNREFARKVTVRHFLTHMAGAGDIDLFGADMAGVRARVHSVTEMVALHSNRPPAFEPGTKQVYGNFGHVVLGRMVEILSGKSFDTYLTENIFAPAGMASTSSAECTDNAADIAPGYVQAGGKLVRNCATLPARGFPAGGQVSTARDMPRFTEALRTGKLIPPVLFAEATRTHHEFMGLGFFATGYGDNVPKRDFRWGHGGSADGICTDIRIYPETGETIVILSNRDGPGCYGVANLLHRN
jgi:D-alanyl-D-alanine carboxypeptidase